MTCGMLPEGLRQKNKGCKKIGNILKSIMKWDRDGIKTQKVG